MTIKDVLAPIEIDGDAENFAEAARVRVETFLDLEQEDFDPRELRAILQSEIEELRRQHSYYQEHPFYHPNVAESRAYEARAIKEILNRLEALQAYEELP